MDYMDSVDYGMSDDEDIYQSTKEESNNLATLPIGWEVVQHETGINLYVNKDKRLCSVTKPYEDTDPEENAVPLDCQLTQSVCQDLLQIRKQHIDKRKRLSQALDEKIAKVNERLNVCSDVDKMLAEDELELLTNEKQKLESEIDCIEDEYRQEAAAVQAKFPNATNGEKTTSTSRFNLEELRARVARTREKLGAGEVRDSERRKSPSPRRRSRSPRRRSRSPRRSSRSPRRRSRSPRRSSRSPRRRSRSLTRRSRSPRRRSRSPRKRSRSRSPRRRSRSPRRKSRSPRRRSRSPRKRSRSPRRKSKSPNRRSRSPKRTSPRRKSRSPSRRSSQSPSRSSSVGTETTDQQVQRNSRRDDNTSTSVEPSINARKSTTQEENAATPVTNDDGETDKKSKLRREIEDLKEQIQSDALDIMTKTRAKFKLKNLEVQLKILMNEMGNDIAEDLPAASKASTADEKDDNKDDVTTLRKEIVDLKEEIAAGQLKSMLLVKAKFKLKNLEQKLELKLKESGASNVEASDALMKTMETAKDVDKEKVQNLRSEIAALETLIGADSTTPGERMKSKFKLKGLQQKLELAEKESAVVNETAADSEEQVQTEVKASTDCSSQLREEIEKLKSDVASGSLTGKDAMMAKFKLKRLEQELELKLKEPEQLGVECFICNEKGHEPANCPNNLTDDDDEPFDIPDADPARDTPEPVRAPKVMSLGNRNSAQILTERLKKHPRLAATQPDDKSLADICSFCGVVGPIDVLEAWIGMGTQPWEERYVRSHSGGRGQFTMNYDKHKVKAVAHSEEEGRHLAAAEMLGKMFPRKDYGSILQLVQTMKPSAMLVCEEDPHMKLSEYKAEAKIRPFSARAAPVSAKKSRLEKKQLNREMKLGRSSPTVLKEKVSKKVDTVEKVDLKDSKHAEKKDEKKDTEVKTSHDGEKNADSTEKAATASASPVPAEDLAVAESARIDAELGVPDVRKLTAEEAKKLKRLCGKYRVKLVMKNLLRKAKREWRRESSLETLQKLVFTVNPATSKPVSVRMDGEPDAERDKEHVVRMAARAAAEKERQARAERDRKERLEKKKLILAQKKEKTKPKPKSLQHRKSSTESTTSSTAHPTLASQTAPGRGSKHKSRETVATDSDSSRSGSVVKETHSKLKPKFPNATSAPKSSGEKRKMSESSSGSDTTDDERRVKASKDTVNTTVKDKPQEVKKNKRKLSSSSDSSDSDTQSKSNTARGQLSEPSKQTSADKDESDVKKDGAQDQGAAAVSSSNISSKLNATGSPAWKKPRLSSTSSSSSGVARDADKKTNVFSSKVEETKLLDKKTTESAKSSDSDSDSDWHIDDAVIASDDDQTKPRSVASSAAVETNVEAKTTVSSVPEKSRATSDSTDSSGEDTQKPDAPAKTVVETASISDFDMSDFSDLDAETASKDNTTQKKSSDTETTKSVPEANKGSPRPTSVNEKSVDKTVPSVKSVKEKAPDKSVRNDSSFTNSDAASKARGPTSGSESGKRVTPGSRKSPLKKVQRERAERRREERLHREMSSDRENSPEKDLKKPAKPRQQKQDNAKEQSWGDDKPKSNVEENAPSSDSNSSSASEATSHKAPESSQKKTMPQAKRKKKALDKTNKVAQSDATQSASDSVSSSTFRASKSSKAKKPTGAHDSSNLREIAAPKSSKRDGKTNKDDSKANMKDAASKSSSSSSSSEDEAPVNPTFRSSDFSLGKLLINRDPEPVKGKGRGRAKETAAKPARGRVKSKPVQPEATKDSKAGAAKSTGKGRGKRSKKQAPGEDAEAPPSGGDLFDSGSSDDSDDVPLALQKSIHQQITRIDKHLEQEDCPSPPPEKLRMNVTSAELSLLNTSFTEGLPRLEVPNVLHLLPGYTVKKSWDLCSQLKQMVIDTETGADGRTKISGYRAETSPSGKIKSPGRKLKIALKLK